MAEKPKHGEWIDINEKLPPNYGGQDVLVYSPKAYSPIDVKTFYGNGEGGGKFQKGWNKGESEYEVTHWMPLPKPPTKN
jgi:Protein of unknown function (DUF551)